MNRGTAPVVVEPALREPIVQVSVPPTSFTEPTVGLVPIPAVGPTYVRPAGRTSVTTTPVASAGP